MEGDAPIWHPSGELDSNMACGNQGMSVHAVYDTTVLMSLHDPVNPAHLTGRTWLLADSMTMLALAASGSSVGQAKQG